MVLFEFLRLLLATKRRLEVYWILTVRTTEKSDACHRFSLGSAHTVGLIDVLAMICGCSKNTRFSLQLVSPVAGLRKPLRRRWRVSRSQDVEYGFVMWRRVGLLAGVAWRRW